MNLRPGVIKTNPVFCIKTKFDSLASIDEPVSQLKLIDWLKYAEALGARFPNSVRADYFDLVPHFELAANELNTRVVGLVIDKETGKGLVCPLKTVRGEWKRSENLPFDVTEIQQAVYRIANASGRLKSSWTPELVGFEIDEDLGRDMTGESMTIAGLLAVIDAHNAYASPIFQRACAVVMPDGDQLVPVKQETIEAKLDAFVREYSTGSLLVYYPRCKISRQYFEHFSDQWPVASFDELASRLGKANQLSKLFEAHPLERTEVDMAVNTIARLNKRREYNRALEFAQRVKSCLPEPDPRIGQWITDLCRHTGRFKTAKSRSQEHASNVESLGELASYEELLNAKVDKAAGLIDDHNFESVLELLNPEYERLTTTPQLASAFSRCKLLNTLARATVILKLDGWKELFEKSIAIQEARDGEQPDVSRNFFIHGLLRHNRLIEADLEIQKQPSNLSETSALFLHFYRADLARRRGTNYPMSDDEESRIRNGHAFGFYLQATARQKGRTVEDCSKRYVLAAEVFQKEVGNSTDINILELFAMFMRLAAALADHKPVDAKAELEKIGQFFRQPGAEKIKEYYKGLIPTADAKIEDMEPLLEAVPYF